MSLGEIATRIIMTQNTKLGSRDHTQWSLALSLCLWSWSLFCFVFFKLHMTKICLKLVRPTLLWLKQSHSMRILCYFIIKSNLSLKNKSKWFWVKYWGLIFPSISRLKPKNRKPFHFLNTKLRGSKNGKTVGITKMRSSWKETDCNHTGRKRRLTQSLHAAMYTLQ